MKALIADDSATMRRMVRNVVQQFGIAEISEASDGAEALCAAGRSEYDLVIVDREMPRHDGVGVTARMRAAGCTAPIVMLSALDDAPTTRSAMDAGVDTYVTKPFSPDVLYQRIRETLGAHGAAG
jgi:DNA-binding response OmpR family regulator